jgi:hypothetical protein
MKQIVTSENNCVWLKCIECEEDLVLEPGMHDYPPPEDVVCDCCLRPITQLKPFKASDVGDVDGVLLVKTYREDNPYDEETHKALVEAIECYQKDGYKDILDWMVDKYGKEKAEKFYAMEVHGSSIFDSWECRDCIMLDNFEYLERYHQALKERAQAQSESHDNFS